MTTNALYIIIIATVSLILEWYTDVWVGILYFCMIMYDYHVILILNRYKKFRFFYSIKKKKQSIKRQT